MKKMTLEETVYEEYTLAKDYKRKYITDRLRKNNDIYKGKVKTTRTKGSSRKEEKEVKKHIGFIAPNIVEIFASTKRPIKIDAGENQKLNEVLTKYANYEFVKRTPRATLVNKIAKTTLREGTCWIGPSWTLRELNKKTKILDKEYWTKETIENRPTLEVYDNFDVFPDPTAKSYKELSYWSVVRENSLRLFKSQDFFDNEKLEKVAQRVLSNEDRRDDAEYIIDQEKIKIVQHWTTAKFDEEDKEERPMVVWFEESTGKVLKKELSPMVRGNIPAYPIGYDEDSENKIWKESLSEILEQDQSAVTSMNREIINHLKASKNGITFFENQGISYNQIQKMRSGESEIYLKDLNKMKQGQFNQIPSSIFGYLQQVKLEMREASGANSSMSALRKASMNKDRAEEQMTNGQQRLAMFVRFISEGLGLVVRDWILMAAEFLSDEEIARIVGEENIQVFRSVLQNKDFSISAEVGTTESITKQMFNLNMIMQQSKQLQQSVPPKIFNGLLVKQYELNDMYDDADALRNFEPPPPQPQENQEEIRQKIENLRMENRKLQAEIEESKVRVLTHQINAKNKERETDANVAYKNAATVEKKMIGQGKAIENAFAPTEKKTQLEKTMEGEKRQYGKF